MNRIFLCFLVFCALWVTGFPAEASTFTVGHDTGYDFHTITDALVVAGSGDTVRVHTGMYKATDPLYPETFPLEMKEGVILKRMETDSYPAINAEQTSYVFNCRDLADGLGTTIQGFIITGGFVDAGDPNTWGGGIFCNNSDLTVINCKIDGNHAYNGGGINVFQSTMSLQGCSVTDNVATSSGGGLYALYSDVCIDNCVFSENYAVNNGGAICAGDGQGFVMVNSAVSGNQADYYGGLYLGRAGSPETLMVNCVIDSNFADNPGGGCGICPGSANDIFTFLNCTIAYNTTIASDGGGVYFDSQCQTNFRDCIIWNNSPDAFDGDLTGVSATFSDIQGGFTGEGNINQDPQFVSGPAGDFYLSQRGAGQSTSSPCMNTGSNLSANISYSACGSSYSLDRMTTRTDLVTDSGHVDMGVHDFGAVTCGDLGTTIEMPADHFTEGDTCYCMVHLCNPGPDSYDDTPVFVILDVYGTYFFAPSFTAFDRYQYTVPPGEITIPVLPQFTWPAGTGSASNIVWYAAMTDTGVTQILGDFDMFSFGWQ